MYKKRKISLTIDEPIYFAIEKMAKINSIAKSHIAQQAFKLWIRNETEKQMAKGYEEMANEDHDFSEMSMNAQREIIL